MDLEEGKEVAWNQVRCTDLIGCGQKDRDEDRERLFAEIRVLKALKHKNIMSFQDSWLDIKSGNINFITELFTSGTLRQYRKRHRHIDDEVLKKWAWQILCGLVYLHGHSPPIIHRDLKCDNIFINGSDGVVKIGDLGLATMLRSRTAPQSVLGTPEFMAPELYEEEYDDRVDVYSFGMCLLELATLEYPYSECQNAAQIYRKVSLGIRPAGLQKVTSAELREFINICISPREQRPRSRQLLKHPYFESVRSGVGGMLHATKSEMALAMGSIHGSMDTLPVFGLPASRTVSEFPSFNGGTPASVLGTLSRTISAATEGGGGNGGGGGNNGGTFSGGPGSDAASVRSQKSNISEMAHSIMTDIIEEEEAAAAAANGNGSDDDGSSGSGGEDGHHHHLVSPHPHGSGRLTRTGGDGGSGGETGTWSPTTTNNQHTGSPDKCGGTMTTSNDVINNRQGGGAGSPLRMGSPPGSEGTEGAVTCDTTSRRFVVLGRYQESSNLFHLRLRIKDPSGSQRTVEFEFDLSKDTAVDVATEMVEDLQLSPDDAVAIAVAIKNEVVSLSSQLEEQVSLSLEQAAAALQLAVTENAQVLHQSGSGGGRGRGHHSRRNSITNITISNDIQSAGKNNGDDKAQATTTSLASSSHPHPLPNHHHPLSPAHPHSSSSGGGGWGVGATNMKAAATTDGASINSLSEIGVKAMGSATSLASVGSVAASVQSMASAVSHQSLGSLASVGSPTPPAPLAAAAATTPAVVAPPVATQQQHEEGSHRLVRSSSFDPAVLREASSKHRAAMTAAGISDGSNNNNNNNSNIGRNGNNTVGPPTNLLGSGSNNNGSNNNGIGNGSSGALSPSSGVLSPMLSGTGYHDKRFSLHQVIENLNELGISGQDIDSSTTEGVLPQSMSTGSLTTSISLTTSTTGGGGLGSPFKTAAAADPTLVVPPRIPQPPRRTSSTASASSSSSEGGEGGEGKGESSSISSLREGGGGGQSNKDRRSPLRRGRSPIVAGGLASMSTPGSKVTSRDGSPTRDGSAMNGVIIPPRLSLDSSPTNKPVTDPSLLIGQSKKPAPLHLSLLPSIASTGNSHNSSTNSLKDSASVKDKEAMRKQAAVDAMKAVEMRSLNLLEGGGALGISRGGGGCAAGAGGAGGGSMGGGKVRGTPMAATKSVVVNAAVGMDVSGTGGVAVPVVTARVPPTTPSNAPVAVTEDAVDASELQQRIAQQPVGCGNSSDMTRVASDKSLASLNGGGNDQ